MPVPTNPAEIFGLFFTDELLEQIVASSNLYASQTQTASQAISWRKITKKELKAYIGFCILMGVAKLPSIADYWQKDPIYNYQPICSRITRDRFRDIRRYLHFIDNSTYIQPLTSRDRLAKVRPVLDYVTKKCQALYKLGRDVAIDEAMVKFQGRSSLKQYLPMKPIKRGIKVWVLADTNGYFWNMQVK